MHVFSRACLLLVLLVASVAKITVAQDTLPFKAVFQPTITQQKTSDGYLTTLRISIPEGYYLYQQKTSPELSVPATLTKSPATEKIDPYFGNVKIYDHRHPAVFTIHQSSAQDEYVLKAQGCRENSICYPPEQWLLSVKTGGPINQQTANTHSTLSFTTLPEQSFLQTQIGKTTAPKTQTDATPATQISPAIQTAQTTSITMTAEVSSNRESAVRAHLDQAYWLTLPWLVLLGLGVSFTACVYPLIPIVTSLVVGQHTSKRRSYGLIVTYVLAMAAAMALLGAVFGWLQINLQIVLQTPWIATLVATFFALLAISMFDIFTLRAPVFLQSSIDRITRRQRAGSFIGAAIMGALSVLVVSPCATPVLTALLLYTTQTTPLKGALALFFFGLGTGLPLLVFASVLRRFMPRAGSWMIVIKRLFAFLLLAVSVWLLGRILPAFATWLLWTLYTLAIAVLLEILTPQTGRLRFLVRYLRGMALIAAIIFAMQAMQSWILPQGASPNIEPQVSFQAAKDSNTLAQMITQSDKPVIVDFTADWCISCRIWDREIWHNPRFARAFQDYRLVEVDITDFTPAHKTLFKRLDLVGPPAVLFYRAGADLAKPEQRVIGEMSADDFAALLQTHPGGG